MQTTVSQQDTDGSQPLVPSVPIYLQLVEQYRKDILEHRLSPGDRIDSIREIQRKHRVARETAKRVLSYLAEKGYITQHAGKGSFVAPLRPLQAIWGVVLPFFSLQYEGLLSRLSAHAASFGREVRIFYDYNDWEQEVRLVRMMLEERFEAVVVIPTLDESKAWSFYSRLGVTDSHVVVFDHTMSYQDFTFVIQSYDLGVLRAVNYLLDKKEGGVAFVKNAGWAGRNMVLELMLETYWMVLRTRRPQVRSLIVERADEVRAEEFKRRHITGVFCCDDFSAIQVIGRLSEQGVKIPGELHVVSYGNTDLARFFTPAVTSVDPHNEEMAAQLARILMERAEGKATNNQQYVVQPRLVVRKT
jgi:DNA-binding LacI/PurR family transcriptional regulator